MGNIIVHKMLHIHMWKTDVKVSFLSADFTRKSYYCTYINICYKNVLFVNLYIIMIMMFHQMWKIRFHCIFVSCHYKKICLLYIHSYLPQGNLAHANKMLKIKY